jgi:hypothetical protein
MTTPRTTASAPARPLPPALDKTFKIRNGAQGPRREPGGRRPDLAAVLEPARHRAPRPHPHELSKAPHDIIARHLLPTSSHLTTSTTLFSAIYLLSHSIAKVVLVALVLRDKLWAHPSIIALPPVFVACPLYRITGVQFGAGRPAPIRRRSTAW